MNEIWNKVAESFGRYIDAISKEQLADISRMAAEHSGDVELKQTKLIACKLARQHKSSVYVEHVKIVDEAIKSGIPCPW